MIESITQAKTANTPAIVTSGGDVIAANAKRKGWMIQNTGTNALFVRFGTGASATVFHAVLKGGTGDNDGNGGSISQMGPVVYQGIISATGTSPKMVVTELSR
jgi:hypothetical protein